jgi:hypothetical protein
MPRPRVHARPAVADPGRCAASRGTLASALAEGDARKLPWEARHGLDLPSCGETLRRLAAKGYYPLSLCGYAEAIQRADGVRTVAPFNRRKAPSGRDCFAIRDLLDQTAAGIEQWPAGEAVSGKRRAFHIYRSAYAMISRIGLPKSISSRLCPGTSIRCGSRPSWCSTVAWMSVT